MSIHHRRYYTAGTSALDASGQKPTKRDSAPRSASSISPASAPPWGPRASRPEAGKIVELYPASGSLRPKAKAWRPTGLLGSQAGMATAEYAIATLAAVGFAGLLVFILRSDEVRGFLLNLIRTALALP